MPPAPGDRIDGWVVERTISTGVSSTVLVCHPVLAPRRRLVMKHLRVSPPPHQRARVYAELRRLTRVRHPHLARVLACQTEGPDCYLILERVRGLPLREALARRPLPEVEALALARDLAGALAALHEVGLHHRDLKPANVLLVGLRRAPVLVDVGVVARDKVGRLGRKPLRSGDPAYTPPEAMLRDPPDLARWDLYALGALLYTCLTRARPELSEAAPQRRAACLDPGEGVSPGLRGLVQELTAAAPAARPGTAAEVQARAAALLEAATARAPARGAWPSPALCALALLTAGVGLHELHHDGRVVSLSVAGLPEGVPVHARVGAHHSRSRDLVFPAQPPGPVEVELTAGPGCSLGGCPGPGCPTCCASARGLVEVRPGWGRQPAALTLPDIPWLRPRVLSVELGAARTLGSARLRFEQGGQVVWGEPDAPVTLLPGDHELTVIFGECPPRALDCLDAGTCPPGCVADRRTVTVPCGEGPLRLPLHLPLDQLPPLPRTEPAM